MQEIKFKAWDRSQKRWINPSDIRISGNGSIYKRRDARYCGHFDIAWESVTDVEIVFPTGIKDINSKDIHTGDIVHESHQTGEKTIGLIKWDDRGAAFFLATQGGGFPISWNPLEIIGNIYENPELVKEQKNGTDATT